MRFYTVCMLVCLGLAIAHAFPAPQVVSPTGGDYEEGAEEAGDEGDEETVGAGRGKNKNCRNGGGRKKTGQSAAEDEDVEEDEEGGEEDAAEEGDVGAGKRGNNKAGNKRNRCKNRTG